MNKQRIAAFGIVVVIVGLIFASGYARAASFNERFAAVETPKVDEETPKPSGEWSIKLLLLIDNKIARSITYSEETFPTGEACKDAILADTKLQSSMQDAAEAAVQAFGPTAALAIACVMHLD